MTVSRTFSRGAGLAAALLLLAGPASAATGDTTTRGTASTTSVPLHVEALNLPVDLGRTTLTATTDGDTTDLAPWSTVQLTLANIGGARFGDVAVRSDGTTTASDFNVTRSTDFGDVGARTGDLFAVANDTGGSATAVLTTLTTDATVLDALNLSVTVTDVLAHVDAAGAAATHSLAVAGVDLDVVAVLGGVLDELPLDILIDLATNLGVTVPEGLGDTSAVIDATTTLLNDVAAAVLASGLVDGAVDDLVTADGGTLSELEALLAALQTLDLLDLPAFLLSNPLLEACELAATLEAAETCLGAEITDHLATLTDEVLLLDEAVDAYLEAVGDVLLSADAIDGSSLSTILDGLTELLDGLLDVEFGSIGEINVTQQARAIGSSLEGSSASHTCDATAVTVPGLDTIEIEDCDVSGTDGLQAAIDTITGTLDVLLSTIGGVDLEDGVSLELFSTVEDTVADREDGFITATSVMEVLALAVPDVTVRPCDVAVVGDLACALGGELDILTPLFDAIGDLSVAQKAVTDALDTVEPILIALTGEIDASAGTEAAAAVEAALGVLQQALGALDFGTLGTAIAIPGARVVVDPTLETEHQVTTASVGNPTPAGDPAPGDPSDDPALPNTGGGAALMAILALGAGAWLWRRREVQ